MRVAIYARVSLDREQDDKRYQNPDNQIEPLKNWARDMGWEVVEIFVDKGSGADPSRQNWRKMMAQARQRRFMAIIVWKLDRFSREGISQVFAYISDLKKRGVALKSMTESWLDTSKDNPMAELTLAVMAWAAEWERRKISERTKAGIQRRKNIGVWKGGRAPNCRKCGKPVRSKKYEKCSCENPEIPEHLKEKYLKKRGGMFSKERRRKENKRPYKRKEQQED